MPRKINCNLRKNRNDRRCKTNNSIRRVGEAEFSVLMPKRDNSGRKINNKLYQKYISRINNRFGGSSTNPNILGCFKNKDKNRIECETNIKITAVRDFENPFDDNDNSDLTPLQKRRLLEQDFNFMKNLSKDAGDEFGQTAMLTIRDNIDDASLILTKRKERLSDDKLFDDFFNKHV